MSVVINPLWPDAQWDVSGAFVSDRELLAFYDFCHLLLGFKPFSMVHGAPLFKWNSGRVHQRFLRSAEEIRAAGLEYEKRNIPVYLTFSNTLLQEEHLQDKRGNAVCSFFSRHNPTGRNAVILSSDILRQHLRREFPTLRLVSSILKITTMGGKGKLSVYQQQAEKYDEVMVHPDDVLNLPLLEKLPDKERYILLVNEYCIRNCPLRPWHYKDLSETALDFLGYEGEEFAAKQATNGCMNIHTLLADEHKSVLCLNTPEMQQLYDMGFRHFKVQGRGNANAFALLSDFMRLIWRRDAAHENTMHSLSQRFWDILPPYP